MCASVNKHANMKHWSNGGNGGNQEIEPVKKHELLGSKMTPMGEKKSNKQ